MLPVYPRDKEPETSAQSSFGFSHKPATGTLVLFLDSFPAPSVSFTYPPHLKVNPNYTIHALYSGLCFAYSSVFTIRRSFRDHALDPTRLCLKLAFVFYLATLNILTPQDE